MEVKGRIIQKLDPLSGTSKAGNQWSKQEYVLETIENFPRKIFFDFFGDRANQYPLNVGDLVNLSFDIESREYQGRWYTSIRGWKAEKIDENAVAPQPQVGVAPAAPSPVAPQDVPDFQQSSPDDDLPF